MSRQPRDTEAAEKGLTIRFTATERAHLDKLVAMEAAELAAALQGRDVAANIEVSAGGYIRSLVREKARAKGLLQPPAQATLPFAAPVVESTSTPPVVAEVVPVVAEVAESTSTPPVAAEVVPVVAEVAESTSTPPVAAEVVHRALVAAVKAGRKQAEIARAVGVDAGHLSRFKREGSGFAGENLAKLAAELGL